MNTYDNVLLDPSGLGLTNSTAEVLCAQAPGVTVHASVSANVFIHIVLAICCLQKSGVVSLGLARDSRVAVAGDCQSKRWPSM